MAISAHRPIALLIAILIHLPILLLAMLRQDQSERSSDRTSEAVFIDTQPKRAGDGASLHRPQIETIEPSVRMREPQLLPNVFDVESDPTADWSAAVDGAVQTAIQETLRQEAYRTLGPRRNAQSSGIQAPPSPFAPPPGTSSG